MAIVAKNGPCKSLSSIENDLDSDFDLDENFFMCLKTQSDEQLVKSYITFIKNNACDQIECDMEDNGSNSIRVAHNRLEQAKQEADKYCMAAGISISAVTELKNLEDYLVKFANAANVMANTY